MLKILSNCYQAIKCPQVAEILKKPEAERTGEEKMILDNSPDLVSDIEKKQRAKELKEQRKQEVFYTNF